MILETLLGVLLSLLVNEMCDVSTFIAEKLLKWGARRIPGEGNAERYEEEWLALLQERPGKLLKLAFAAWLVIRSTCTLRSIYRRRGIQARSSTALQTPSLDSLSYADFEALVANLARRDGFVGTVITNGPGDMGIDLVATAPDGRRVGFQVKKFGDRSRPVSSVTMHQVSCARVLPQMDELVVVTNGSFTQQARQFAGHHRIHMIGGDEFERWIAGDRPFDEIL